MSDRPAPSMLSAEFHYRFLPALLKSRFGNQVAASKASFVSASFWRCLLVLYGAIALSAVGFALYPGIGGWFLLALAAVGVVYALVVSVLEARGTVPTYEAFQFPWFFFCLALGLAAGALFGVRESTAVRLGYAGAGVLVGYGAGLLAGQWGQRMGFFSVLLYPLAIAGSCGVLLTAMLLLST